jgi:hypothetical protein
VTLFCRYLHEEDTEEVDRAAPAAEQLQITERHLRRMRENARKGYRQQAMDAFAWMQNARL